MSYILNALNKAERDRKREESGDLDDFVSAGWDPYQEQVKSNNSYILAAIILVIAILLFLGFYSLNNRSTVLISEPAVELGVEQVIEEPTVADEQPVIKEIEKAVEKAPPLKAPEPEDIQLPEVSIAGHIYIRSGSPKNRIFIDDKTYYVGDAIDSDWVIESINFDSLSLSSGTMSTELPLR